MRRLDSGERMETGKIGVGEVVAGVSGLALFIFMFMPWYADDGLTSELPGGDWSAWQAFAFVDVLLFLISVVVVGLVLVQVSESNPELPSPPARIVMGAGLLALALILLRLIFQPDLGASGFSAGADPAIGSFLGLLAAAGIAYGGWRASREPVQSDV